MDGREQLLITVTLLGTSALLPLPGRAETAAVLSCGGRSVLFDCGEGTQTAARAAGVSLMKTDVVALTHYHGDHIFGLPGLCQTMSVLGRTEPLTVVGPGDVEKELEHIVGLMRPLSFELRLVPMPAEGMELGGGRLTAFETAHRGISQGYRFDLPRAGRFLPERAAALHVPQRLWGVLQKGGTVEADGRVVRPEDVLGGSRRGLSVVFTGDTLACESVERAAHDADLLLCEATYGEDGQAELAAQFGHMTFSEAGRLAANAGARRLWLMHYSQMIKDPGGYLPNAQRYYPGAECGFDGKSVVLGFEE